MSIHGDPGLVSGDKGKLKWQGKTGREKLERKQGAHQLPQGLQGWSIPFRVGLQLFYRIREGDHVTSYTCIRHQKNKKNLCEL